MWDPPRSSGGLPLTGFKIYRALNSTEFIYVPSIPNEVNSAIITFTDNSVTAGFIHSYRISAMNMLFEGIQSSPIRIIAANLPQRPSNPPLITYFSVTSATIQISTVTDDGGSPITGYLIEIDNMDPRDPTAFKTVSDSM